jgi:hypothetical protein
MIGLVKALSGLGFLGIGFDIVLVIVDCREPCDFDCLVFVLLKFVFAVV